MPLVTVVSVNDVALSGSMPLTRWASSAGTSASVSRQTRYRTSGSADGDQLSVTLPLPAEAATPWGVGSVSGRILVIRYVLSL